MRSPDAIECSLRRLIENIQIIYAPTKSELDSLKSIAAYKNPE